MDFLSDIKELWVKLKKLETFIGVGVLLFGIVKINWQYLLFHIISIFLNHNENGIDLYHTFYVFLILFSIFYIIKLVKKAYNRHWIEKIEYNQIEHTNEYIADILQWKSDTFSTTQNMIESFLGNVYGIFRQKSIDCEVVFLELSRNKFIAKYKNTEAKSLNLTEYHKFNTGEGVVGKAWNSGEVEFFDKNISHKDYKSRNQCANKAYLCFKVGNYGILSVGSNNGFTITDIDKQSLRLFSTMLKYKLDEYDNKQRGQGKSNMGALQR